MDRSILNFAAFTGVIIAVGWLLYIGQNLLVPLVIAIIIWFLITAITEYFENSNTVNSTNPNERWSIPNLPSWWKLPRWLAMTLAIFVFGLLTQIIVSLVSSNLQSFIEELPSYQTKLESLISKLTELSGIQIMENLRSSIPDLSMIVSAVTSAVGDIFSVTTFVILYLVFLLVEQTNIKNKIESLKNYRFIEKGRADRTIKNINYRIKKYISVKTIISCATGLITGIFLQIMELPFAITFGLIAFFLNFIPTIGSLISVIFPTALALVHYGTPEQLITFEPIVILVALGTIQFSIGNLIEPKLMGGHLNISSLVILIMLVFWGSIWGILGAIMSVPMTVIIMILCEGHPRTKAIAILLSEKGGIEDLDTPEQEVQS